MGARDHNISRISCMQCAAEHLNNPVSRGRAPRSPVIRVESGQEDHASISSLRKQGGAIHARTGFGAVLRRADRDESATDYQTSPMSTTVTNA